MTLHDILARQIASGGPVSLAAYMSECLLHPEHGYYTSSEPFGRDGDFITAPDISQMFGELLGLCLAQAWLDQGAPKPFVLAEFGPGRGTLMADAMRAGRAVPGFVQAAQVVLLEASPRLRTTQAQTLAPVRPTWIERPEDLPEAPLFLIANEFFDALPIRQFVRHEGAVWRERLVGLDPSGRLGFGFGPPVRPAELAHRSDVTSGQLVECRPAADAILVAIGSRIARHGGAALIVDYGDWRSLGDTFQAVKAHAPVDPFAEPGAADLTAHVDFEALARAAPCAVSQMTPQGVFLQRLGIAHRADALARGLDGRGRAAQMAALHRLTHADEMGTLFKVLGLYPEGADPPPGLVSNGA